jgi:hypothetical protein
LFSAWDEQIALALDSIERLALSRCREYVSKYWGGRHV